MNPEFEKIVRGLYPADAELDLEFHDEGCCNSTIIVNKEDVYRFPKENWAFSSMEKDVKLMEGLKAAGFTDVPEYKSYNGVYALFSYMKGADLTTELVESMDDEERKRAARDLGALLYRMHQNTQIDFKPAGTTLSKEGYISLLETAKTYFPRLTSVGIHFINMLYDQLVNNEFSWDYEPKFVHGDLAPFHIKYDMDEKKIKGIIDFGEAGIGDPATDLSPILYYLGEKFTREMAAGYPGMEEMLPRAKFYAKSLEVYWFVSACEGRGDIFFGPHLGCYKGY